jgi:hypothetical protein
VNVTDAPRLNRSSCFTTGHTNAQDEITVLDTAAG